MFARRGYSFHGRLDAALRRAAGCFALAGRVTLGRFHELERIGNLIDHISGDHPGLSVLGGQIAGSSMQVRRGTGRFPEGPWAKKPTIMPVNTSPVPAVAMPGLPVGQIATAPSGRAMTVRAPFKTTNTPRSRAKRAAVPIRSR